MVPAALLIVIVAIAFIAFILIDRATLTRRIAVLEKHEAEDRRKLDDLRGFLEDVIIGHAGQARLKSALRRMYSTEDDRYEMEDRLRQRAK